MEEKKETFNYTYSAKQQEEIKNIRKKYAAPEEDKMEQLRRIDRKVTQKAQKRSISIGVVGALIMGTGMSLVMTDIGELVGGFSLVLGVAVGLVGMALVALAYPVYNRTLRKERRRRAPEIIRLSDELMK
ncbi:MAG: hypothetical protein IJY96_07725 [Oscillospiraceae bacterium]|nr:hypothetical protein [Oscillospiraceae bacterium]